MLAELPLPQALIPASAHQLSFDQPAIPKHPIPTQSLHGAGTVLLGIKKCKNRRSTPAHPDTRTKFPQPSCYLPDLGMLLEYDRFEIVRAERTRRHRASPVTKRAHEDLETINPT